MPVIERMQSFAIRIALLAIVFLIVSVVVIVAIAWCHIPAKRNKRRR